MEIKLNTLFMDKSTKKEQGKESIYIIVDIIDHKVVGIKPMQYKGEKYENWFDKGTIFVSLDDFHKQYLNLGLELI